jgi:hypothetical protein
VLEHPEARPKESRSLSEHSVPENARASSSGGGLCHEQEEGLRRFDDASLAFLPPVTLDVAGERLERAGRTMDSWARRLS